MTALTLRVIQKNPPVTLHEILKTPLMHGHFHIAAKFTFISREGTSYFNEWEIHFQWGIHFQVERAPHWGCICLDDGGGMVDKKIHGVGGTPIMPLPTRTNLGLCCNRIKKKHELQYTLENLQEQHLNFTRKGTSSQITFGNISQICAACLFNG